MRVVLDTNVLISALLAPASLPGALWRFGREGRLRLVTSPAMLDELDRVLAYPKIAKRIGWTAAQRAAFVAACAREMEVVDITGTSATVPADSGDDMVLATLLASRAEALITGDAGLLDLAARYPILTPAEFLDHARGGEST